MRYRLGCLVLGCCACVGALTTAAAASRKPGMWEITTTTTWQKAPMIEGAEGDKLRGGTHTKQVCLTEEMIDQYGALLPQSRGQCTVENRMVKDGKVTGDYVCSGMMTGKGQLESVWRDNEHAVGTVHFVGAMQVGSETQPVEWTTETQLSFKGSSCGAVRLPAMSGHRK